MRYHRIDTEHLRREDNPRSVVHWKDAHHEAINFLCPCGQRSIYVTSPPHIITFDENGILESLGGSCGYRPVQEVRNKQGEVVIQAKPENWCHFTIDNGIATMHNDSQCPGRNP